jgi:hypothetical protein
MIFSPETVGSRHKFDGGDAIGLTAGLAYCSALGYVATASATASAAAMTTAAVVVFFMPVVAMGSLAFFGVRSIVRHYER